MIEFNNILSVNQLAEYQNNLVAANQDYFSGSESIVSNDVVEIDLIIPSYPLPNNTYLFSDGTGAYRIFINYIANQLGYVGGVPLLWIDGVSYPASTDLSLHAGSVLTVRFTSTVSTTLNTIGAFSSVSQFMNGNIRNFTIKGQLYGMNEANGLTIYGDSGGTWTRNTSAANPLDYINSTMIQRYA